MKATLTPWPVIPRDRAVFAFGASESAWIVCSASGLSWTLPGAAQAPASGETGAPVVVVLVACAGASWISWSGTTWLTAGFDLSCEASLEETVAVSALITV